MQKSLVEINGIKYMSPKAAGDMWGMNCQKVTSACKDGRVVGAVKDSSNHFIIPINSLHPLEKEQIRTILIALLVTKNNTKVSLPSGIEQLLDYLRSIGLIEGRDTLTDKGMKLATSGKEIQIDWKNVAMNILGIISNLASIWSAIPK